MDKIFLDEQYDFFMNKIKMGDNFLLLRYGDGERSIMTGKAVKAQEGWSSPSYITKLGRDIEKTLSLYEKNVYYGISCPCCDREAYYWYSSRINNSNITFANLFVNINYRRFIKDFGNIKRDAVIIGNIAGCNNKIGNLNVLKYYPVGNQCQSFWDNEGEDFVDGIIKDYGDKNNILYVVSAGPMAEPILFRLYKNNPNNCYIDFGSAVDCYIHQKDTRPYVNPNSEFGKRNCWMPDPRKTDFNVSVLLTTYKKPDALEKQLEAIRVQSLKPSEIILFQDGISEGYSINFSKDFLSNFDKISINNENQGVWKRFQFAKDESSCNYICIFDDDTIPGHRWLENCHYNMIHREGVYGTVGILVKNAQKYPYGGFHRIGWHNPYTKTAKVDFVGHSWFLKKEYLEYMFDGTEKYQQYKRAAEDMCLSFKCNQHGISTYVPPHPYYDLSLWGSQPKSGIQFGNASVAVSQNYDNCIYMREALNDFVKAGWNFVYQKDQAYVRKILKGAKKESYKAYIKRGLKMGKKVGYKLKRKIKKDV